MGISTSNLIQATVLSVANYDSYQTGNGTIYTSKVRLGDASPYYSGEDSPSIDPQTEWEIGHKTEDCPWSIGEQVTFKVAQSVAKGDKYNKVKRDRPQEGVSSSGSGMAPSKKFENAKSAAPASNRGSGDREVSIELQACMKMAVGMELDPHSFYSELETHSLKLYETLQRMKTKV